MIMTKGKDAKNLFIGHTSLNNLVLAMFEQIEIVPYEVLNQWKEAFPAIIGPFPRHFVTAEFSKLE